MNKTQLGMEKQWLWNQRKAEYCTVARDFHTYEMVPTEQLKRKIHKCNEQAGSKQSKHTRGSVIIVITPGPLFLTHQQCKILFDNPPSLSFITISYIPTQLLTDFSLI